MRLSIGSLSTRVNQIPIGSHNWTCESFDVSGASNSTDNRTFQVIEGLIERSQFFNTSSFETATEDFVVDIIFNSSSFTSITGLLNYNGTGFIGTRSGTGDKANFTAQVTIPLTIPLENRTFFWVFNLTNSSGTTPIIQDFVTVIVSEAVCIIYNPDITVLFPVLIT